MLCFSNISVQPQLRSQANHLENLLLCCHVFLACFHIRVFISTLCTQKSEDLSAVKNTDRKMVF